MKLSGTQKKILKRLLFLAIIVYFAYTFISQQKTLNAYANEEIYYAKQIEQEKEKKEKLASVQERINSNDYIEEVARETLDMYLPNERVYIDIGK